MLKINEFSDIQLKRLSLEFAQELRKASKNEISELSFDSNKIDNFTQIKTQKPFQILYIGGSHIESAIVQKKPNGQTIILKTENFELSKINSTEEFYEIICAKISPNIDYLLLNIAAHLKLVSDQKKVDSILVKNHRIHNLEGLIGKQIGGELETQIQQKTGRQIQVSALNNLVSLGMLAGENKNNFATTIAGVVATGINFGFFEGQSNFINLEAGKWRIKGNQISDIASTKGIIRSYNAQAEKLNLTKIDSLLGINKILKRQDNSLEFEILNQLIIQSAKLVATQIAGIYFYKKELLSKSSLQLKFLLEGSLFWEVGSYKKLVEKTLLEIGLEIGQIHFSRVKFGFILGSSKSVRIQIILEEKRVFVIQKLFGFRLSFSWFSLAPPAQV
jgi:hypothetical protein